jgi:hypothetical protein
MYVTSNFTGGEGGTIAKFRSPVISADAFLCFNFYLERDSPMFKSYS